MTTGFGKKTSASLSARASSWPCSAACWRVSWIATTVPATVSTSTAAATDGASEVSVTRWTSRRTPPSATSSRSTCGSTTVWVTPVAVSAAIVAAASPIDAWAAVPGRSLPRASTLTTRPSTTWTAALVPCTATPSRTSAPRTCVPMSLTRTWSKAKSSASTPRASAWTARISVAASMAPPLGAGPRSPASTPDALGSSRVAVDVTVSATGASVRLIVGSGAAATSSAAVADRAARWRTRMCDSGHRGGGLSGSSPRHPATPVRQRPPCARARSAPRPRPRPRPKRPRAEVVPTSPGCTPGRQGQLPCLRRVSRAAGAPVACATDPGSPRRIPGPGPRWPRPARASPR